MRMLASGVLVLLMLGCQDDVAETCVPATPDALSAMVTAAEFLPGFNFTHQEVDTLTQNLMALRARATMLQGDTITGTGKFLFACTEGQWALVPGATDLSLQDLEGKVTVAAGCPAGCDACIADGYRCTECIPLAASDSARLIKLQCVDRIPYESMR